MPGKLLCLDPTESRNTFTKRRLPKRASSQPPQVEVECGDDFDVPCSFPNKKFCRHSCSRECIESFDQLPPHVEKNLNQINILLLPFYYGFRRFYVMFPNTNAIVYTSPCGKVLYIPSHIYEYLSVVLDEHFPLDVNNFTFSLNFDIQQTTFKSFDYLPDMTHGKEDRPISLINTMYNYNSNIRFNYKYIKDRIYAKELNVEKIRRDPSVKCDVNHRCMRWHSCACQKKMLIANFNHLNGYIHKKLYHKHAGGIYECHDRCKCGPKCPNRLVQNGITSNLQLFRTYSKGWGIRTLAFIPKGTFVACYSTMVTPQDKVSTDNTYHADIDFSYLYWQERKHFYKTNLINRLTGKTANKQLFEMDFDESDVYVQDGSLYSNIARFFNHSCEPNLFCQSVFVDIQDARVPLTALFAYRDILPFEELVWDYNNIQFISSRKSCECGSLKCASLAPPSDQILDDCD